MHRSRLPLDPDRPPPSDVELRYGYRAFIISNVSKIAGKVIVAGASLWIVWMLTQAIVSVSHDMAGKTTQANVGVDINARVEGQLNVEAQVESDSVKALGKWLARSSTVWSLLALGALAGIAYGFYSHVRRKDAIQQFAPFRKRFEITRDPRRSSVELTDRGDTPKED